MTPPYSSLFREKEVLDRYHEHLCHYLSARGLGAETYSRQQLEEDHLAASAECEPAVALPIAFTQLFATDTLRRATVA